MEIVLNNVLINRITCIDDCRVLLS